ncbi:MAG: DUF234 domain-containing protein [Sulfurospirillaceae bacterium]|nr:DUF234 domain-containing protein [Sulfurospirillaceae bacterium]
MQSKFQNFKKKFPYLNIEECIIYYSIFDGHHNLSNIKFTNSLNTTIKEEIIDKIEELKSSFIYDKEIATQKLLEKILTRIAKGDRKSYTVYNKEKLSQTKGRVLYKYLFENKIIKKEKSRETPIKTSTKQLIKKDLRRYKIQDKLQFSDNFTRFWFTFIAPNIHKNEISYEIDIAPFLDKFISLEFENLSNELLRHVYKNEQIISTGGYWDKNLEIDLLIKTNSLNIAGEAKWKNTKICKNVLNSLINKCQKADLGIDKFALFSKSGYSKELESKKYVNIELYTLDDFERLFND